MAPAPAPTPAKSCDSGRSGYPALVLSLLFLRHMPETLLHVPQLRELERRVMGALA